MGEFCLLVELHLEGSALQPMQQACFLRVQLGEIYEEETNQGGQIYTVGGLAIRNIVIGKLLTITHVVQVVWQL